jgi:hypothetical protein
MAEAEKGQPMREIGAIWGVFGWFTFIGGFICLSGAAAIGNAPSYATTVSYDWIATRLVFAIIGAALTGSGAVMISARVVITALARLK